MNEMVSKARRVLVGTAAAAFAVAALGGTGASIVSATHAGPTTATHVSAATHVGTVSALGKWGS